MVNRLANETSPYLLQHAQNPVDWYPWGQEALDRAKREDKPIVLSVGYSACHWCHVMAHESFENEAIARQMNENFVNIKVDREERPDIDHIYMEAVQALTGRGGWPMTVFLTPEGKPFYGGTYFPPQDRQGLPGFPRVLQTVSDAYRHRRGEVDQAVRQIQDAFDRIKQAPGSTRNLSEITLTMAHNGLAQSFDSVHGGFGRAPKFPNPLTLDFLLRYYLRTNDNQALEMVEFTLEKMAAGGMYDQIGGGFHRYSTDDEWLVPHFEKMLYDNALLAQVYTHAFLITGNRYHATVVQEILDYVLREMKDSRGGFYSSQDADTEGEEGKYYLWTPDEMRESLGPALSFQLEGYYGVAGTGKFEGRNILHRTGSPVESQELNEGRLALLKRREQRTRPGRDDKILASWNGLMLTAFAEAARTLQREDYLQAAIANGTFLRDVMASGGRLMHSYKDGRLKVDGFLEDYACVIQGFLELHQTTLQAEWLESAFSLTRSMVERFYDEPSGILYDTASHGDKASEGSADRLFVRPHNDFDGATPSGASTAATVLLKVAVLEGNEDYRRIAERAFAAVKNDFSEAPLGFSQWLSALDFYLSTPQEVVFVGPSNAPATRDLAKIVFSKWRPNTVVAARDRAGGDTLATTPLFQGRGMLDGKPTAYVCEANACRAPVTDPAKLAEELQTSRP